MMQSIGSSKVYVTARVPQLLDLGSMVHSRAYVAPLSCKQPCKHLFSASPVFDTGTVSLIVAIPAVVSRRMEALKLPGTEIHPHVPGGCRVTSTTTGIQVWPFAKDHDFQGGSTYQHPTSCQVTTTCCQVNSHVSTRLCVSMDHQNLRHAIYVAGPSRCYSRTDCSTFLRSQFLTGHTICAPDQCTLLYY